MAEARLRRCGSRGSHFIIFIVLLGGCDRGKVQPAAPAQRPPAIRGLPVEMTVKQRSTTAVPGSNETLRITIDDITAGQVMVSMADKDGKSVLASTSLKEGEGAEFQFQRQKYQVTLSELENELVGEDFATIVVSAGGTPSSPRRVPSNPALPARHGESPAATRGREQKDSTSAAERVRESEELTEREKIERLLQVIESAEGVVFIRNGARHSPKDATEHLRSKWNAAGGEIKTADDFIDKIASKSSLSGEPYRVRLADGTEVVAGEYLKDKLSEIEESSAAK